MASKNIVTRRIFLIGMFSLGLIFLARFLLPKFAVFRSRPAEGFEKKLVQLFNKTKSAKVVGLEYFKGVPEERDRQRLISSISSSIFKNGPVNTKTDTQKLRELLCICRQRDFEEGRVTEVRGWPLSITEARLCALVALQPSFF